MNKQPYVPDRGDIIWLIFDPRIGHEQSGRRPAIILSRRKFTERTGLAVVCPITSKRKGLPFEIELHDTQTEGVVLPIHLRSADVLARKSEFIEHAPADVLELVLEHVAAIIN